jgi:hypothetical protein
MPHHPSQTRASLRFLALLILWIGDISAQTFYRCGDQYTAHASCDTAKGQTLQDTRSTAQEHAQQALTRKTQQEADALERSRINAERQTAPLNTPPATFPQDNAMAQSKLPEPINNPSSRGRRHAASPYFTAKDGPGSKKVNTKSSAAKSKAATPP